MNTTMAPKRPKVIVQHRRARLGDYFWLRDREDRDVLKYLHAEQDHFEEIMKHTKPLQEQLFQEMKGRIKEADSSAPEKNGEYLYYTRYEAGHAGASGRYDKLKEVISDFAFLIGALTNEMNSHAQG